MYAPKNAGNHWIDYGCEPAKKRVFGPEMTLNLKNLLINQDGTYGIYI